MVLQILMRVHLGLIDLILAVLILILGCLKRSDLVGVLLYLLILRELLMELLRVMGLVVVGLIIFEVEFELVVGVVRHF